MVEKISRQCYNIVCGDKIIGKYCTRCGAENGIRLTKRMGLKARIRKEIFARKKKIKEGLIFKLRKGEKRIEKFIGDK